MSAKGTVYKICQELERENKIVLILPHYETVENLKKHLLDDGFPASGRDIKNMNICL
jgi:hypothetical protein